MTRGATDSAKALPPKCGDATYWDGNRDVVTHLLPGDFYCKCQHAAEEAHDDQGCLICGGNLNCG